MMSALLSFLAAERYGILVLLLVLVVLGALMNWVLWMCGWGRYRGAIRTDSKLRFVLADFLVKIINDFRHLLALLIFLLFALAVFAAMWPGMMKQDIGLIKDGLQAAAAALGGLIGSIIGYYFGESAASKSRPPGVDLPPPAPAQQEPPTPVVAEGIQAPPKPPNLQK